jgi:sigma-B regulation protein RsbU (phosphoserine phosphatase)
MSDVSASGDAALEVISSDGSRRLVRVTECPFFIGRGSESGKHLPLNDRRISRQCAAITSDGSYYYLEDRGHRHGIFVNGQKVERRLLENSDIITFGLANCYEIIFRTAVTDTAIEDILSQFENVSASDFASGGLRKLNLLLEATSLLHSHLPLESVLGTMLDHAIAVTKADRGLLLEPDSDSLGSFRVRLGRRTGGVCLPPNSVAPSQTAVRLALERQSSVITEDLALADMQLQAAESIVAQRLRAVVAIPLYAMPRVSALGSAIHSNRGNLLGLVYLDSRRPAAFSNLDRRILDALAVEAASILDNARLVERERERQHLEQELRIAREIQQALLPRGSRNFPHLAVSGINFPCRTVGGDYFDIFTLSDDRTAFLLADVSGKGLGAALLSTMLQGALSGLTSGADLVRVFNHLNSFLCERAEMERYATIFFGILDRSGHLEFINAGHPSPLLLRRDEVAEPFGEGSFPVGLVPSAQYAAACVTLQPEDTLVLFSDGVTEAMDPDQQMFGVSRLREVIAGQHGAPLDHLQKSVLDSVGHFTRGASQADDITLLFVRYRAAAQAATP